MSDGAGQGPELRLRAIAIGSYLLSIGAMVATWLQAGRPFSHAVLIAVEVFTLGLIVFARRAERRDMSASQMAAAVFTSVFFVLLKPAPTADQGVLLVTECMAVAGLVVSILAKAWLGRSFGILPAARGLRTGGPYAVVRHPMYLGYIVSNLGFLAGNASLRNASVVAGLILVQLLRIEREERVLQASSDGAAWADYARRVRFRLVPFVY